MIDYKKVNIKDLNLCFIGQGFIGKNLADNFSERGFNNIVRYSLDSEYIKNKDLIKDCDIVFIAVPTPTINRKFDDSILVEALDLVSYDSIAVIKSTVPPQTMIDLFFRYDGDKKIIYCPEFLDENTAKENTDNPERNVIGIPSFNLPEYNEIAELLFKILPKAKNNLVCTHDEASIIKYGANCFFYIKNVYFNILYDLVSQLGGEWNRVREGIIGDSRIHPVHTNIMHKSGRGAGGACLIKDLSAFRDVCKDMDIETRDFLEAAEKRNTRLLMDSKKDLNLLKGVYGITK